MSQVYCDVHVHFVWRTKFNRGFLAGGLEKFVHHRLGEIGAENGVKLLAVNSAWDHVHCLFEWNTSQSFGDVVQKLKCRTSTEWNEMVELSGIDMPKLFWQRGYGVIAVETSNIHRIIAYIANQKAHHHNGSIDTLFETTRRTTSNHPTPKRTHREAR